MSTPRKSKPKSWRDVLPIHPACELLPPLSEAELRVLGENIRQQGLVNEIVLFKEEIGPNEFKLLAGRSRLDAMELVGIDFEIRHTKSGRINVHDVWEIRVHDDIPNPLGSSNLLIRVLYHWDVDDPYQYVISTDLHRRHLTAEEKREVIAKLLEATPNKSDREIAKLVKRDHKTVAAVRRQAEDVGRIPHVATRTDTKGRKQPVKRAKRTPDDFVADIKAKQTNQPEAAKPDVKSASKTLPRSSAAYLMTEMIAHGLKSDPTKTAQHMREVLSAASITKLADWLVGFTAELKQQTTEPQPPASPASLPPPGKTSIEGVSAAEVAS